jgi:hypothetical protein
MRKQGTTDYPGQEPKRANKQGCGREPSPNEQALKKVKAVEQAKATCADQDGFDAPWSATAKLGPNQENSYEEESAGKERRGQLLIQPRKFSQWEGKWLLGCEPQED